MPLFLCLPAASAFGNRGNGKGDFAGKVLRDHRVEGQFDLWLACNGLA